MSGLSKYGQCLSGAFQILRKPLLFCWRALGQVDSCLCDICIVRVQFSDIKLASKCFHLALKIFFFLLLLVFNSCFFSIFEWKRKYIELTSKCFTFSLKKLYKN